MNKYFLSLLFSTMILFMGCSRNNNTVSATDGPTAEVVEITGSAPLSVMPKASAFKMSGDYADNVAITLNADGVITYYPAPSDITESSRPVSLGNGWWLNRQGISPQSRFTRYTFKEYAALSQTPSIEQLKDAIIPGAIITEWKVFPIPASEALSRLDEIRDLLPR